MATQPETRDPSAASDVVVIAERVETGWIVELTGEIDAGNAAVVHDRLAEVAADEGDVTVDLAGLRFIAAAGLNALADWHRRLATSGRRLRLVHTPPTTSRLLHLTGLAELLGDDEPELPTGKGGGHGRRDAGT